jgi:hypothetical protein
MSNPEFLKSILPFVSELCEYIFVIQISQNKILCEINGKKLPLKSCLCEREVSLLLVLQNYL